MRSSSRLFAAATLVIAAVLACSGGKATPTSLSISPADPGTVHGPTLFSAVLVNDDAAITWSLTGAGSLSGTTGTSTTYSPPPVQATGMATLTATSADGFTASVTFALAAPQLAPGTLPGVSAAVTVAYDPEQIPHISCAKEVDCLEAQGYLQARDRLFQMDLFRRTARGQLSTLIGGLETASDQEFLTFFTTRDGQRLETALVDNLDAATAAKINAYVAGVNAYINQLKANPTESLPGEYAQLPFPLTAADIPLWTAEDTYAIGRLQQFQLSETIEEEMDYGLFAETYAEGPLANQALVETWIRAQETQRSYTLPNVNAGAPGRTATHARVPALRAPWLAGYQAVMAAGRAKAAEARGLLGTLGVDTGSNNWAVDAAHSKTGQAMVANDPHLSLQYPPLFHLVAMTAADGSIDMQGGSFPGIPGALIGRGAHVGWGDTVTGYDVTDLYTEQLFPCPTGLTSTSTLCTLFNGAPIGIDAYPQTISVRGGDPVSITVLVNPMHGPFIAFDPTTGKGVSMRWTGHEITSDIRGFLNLNTATAVGGVADVGGSVNTAFAALHDVATGAQNFVLADDQGNIGYDPHALVPKRNWISLQGAPPYPWLPLPGDGSAEWGSGDPADNCAGTGANQPSANCWYADADLPHADGSNSSSTGFLVTANSDPAGYGDANIPIGFKNGEPFYLSFDWDDPTGFREKRITDLLSSTIASNSAVAFSDMQAIQTDHASSLAATMVPQADLVKMILDSSPTPLYPPAFTAAMAMLDAWGTGATAWDCPTGLTTSSPSSAVTSDATVLAHSNACMLFHTYLRILLNNVFDDDLAVAGVGLDSGDAIRAIVYMLSATSLTQNIDQDFCHNVSAAGVPDATTCEAQVVTAMVTAYETLAGFKGAPSNWIWGRAHTLTTTSPASPIINASFGAGPYARPGGALTVDVGNPSLASADPTAFPYSSGSNLRFVAEMNPALPNTAMQLPGPERDGPIGVFASAPDLIGEYVNNVYFPFAFSAEIAAGTVSTQTFTPAAQ